MEGQPTSPSFQFPPGFRFHPSDEELIVYYLQNKVTSRPLPASIIAEIDLYKYNPWELPKKALFGEDEWFFFSPRDRKYPNGERPNRAAGSGYWKATGTDKPIFSSHGSMSLGVKKALVFYTGRPPRGIKTDWMMNEYRLLDTMIKPLRFKGSMRLDDWVLCRVRLKSYMPKSATEVPVSQTAELSVDMAGPTYTGSDTDMITDCLYRDCLLSALIPANQPLPPIQSITSTSANGNSFTSVYKVGGLYDNIEKSPLTVIAAETYFNPLKRKPSAQENGYENILLSNGNGNMNEDFPLNKTHSSHNLNYYTQFHQGIYPNFSEPINDIQELNEFDFTGKYLPWQSLHGVPH